MSDKPKSFDWLNRVWHRPISMIIETVREMPAVKELPVETYLTINLKGNRATGEQLITEIQAQIRRTDFFAVEVTGRNK